MRQYPRKSSSVARQNQGINQSHNEMYENKSAVSNSRITATKAHTQEEHTESNVEAKKSVKIDKGNYFNSLEEEAEQAAGSRNMRQLYDTTRKLAGKYSKPERPVKNKARWDITGTEQQFNRWAEYCEEQTWPTEHASHTAADVDLPSRVINLPKTK